MEHKAWVWRRKSSEKTNATNGKPDLLLAGNEQEVIKFIFTIFCFTIWLKC